jgi:hypothetical protein
MKTIEKTKVSGVYKLYDINKKLIYIGTSSCNLYKRTRQSILDKNADYVSTLETDSDLDASIIEVVLIGKYKPKMNKCTASKTSMESTLEIVEPAFEQMIDVHTFMDKYSLPSIMETKIHRAISHKIVKENPYNKNPSALIYSNMINKTVVLLKNRVNNIFIDMLGENAKGNIITGIIIPCRRVTCNEVKFKSSAKLYTSSTLIYAMGYEQFIPFVEAYSFDLIIVDEVDDFDLVKEIFEKEGLKVWN